MSGDSDNEEKDALWPYIGDWQALQDGAMHRTLRDKLKERIPQLRLSRELPLEDPLARYKAVPLHARFLYTSLDPFIEICICEQYALFDSLSRDRCDIYLSLEQFNNPGEALDYLEMSPVLKQSGIYIAYGDLPGLFFWDHQWQGEYIPFGSRLDMQKIKSILSRIFEEIRREPTIAAVKRAKQALSQM